MNSRDLENIDEGKKLVMHGYRTLMGLQRIASLVSDESSQYILRDAMRSISKASNVLQVTLNQLKGI